MKQNGYLQDKKEHWTSKELDVIVIKWSIENLNMSTQNQNYFYQAHWLDTMLQRAVRKPIHLVGQIQRILSLDIGVIKLTIQRFYKQLKTFYLVQFVRFMMRLFVKLLINITKF